MAGCPLRATAGVKSRSRWAREGETREGESLRNSPRTPTWIFSDRFSGSDVSSDGATALITSVAGRSGATKSNNLWKLKWHLWGSYCCFWPAWVCGSVFFLAASWTAGTLQSGLAPKIYAGFRTSTKTRNQLKTSPQKSLTRKNPYQRKSSYRLHS